MNPQFRYFLRLTPATTVILTLNVVTYVLCFLYQPARLYLANDPRIFPWTAVTYSLLDLSMPLFWFISLAFFWWVGSFLEQSWGTRKFTLAWLVCALLGEAFTLGLTGLPAMSMWYPFSMLLVAWTVLNRGATINLYMVFPISSTVFRWLTIASVVYFMGSRNPVVGLAATIPCFVLWWYAKQAPGRRLLPFATRSKPKPKSRAKLNLVPSEPAPKTVVPLPATPTIPTALEKDIDRILDKIRLEGMAALTPEEKNLLDEHSSRLRRGG